MFCSKKKRFAVLLNFQDGYFAQNDIIKGDSKIIADPFESAIIVILDILLKSIT